MDSLIPQLQEQGLSENEAAVYVHLLRLGTVTIGPLAKAAGLGKQSVYNALELLRQKGLVTEEKVPGKALIYTPHSPQALLDHQAQQRQQLQHLLPELELLRGSAHVVGDVQVIKGLVPFQTFVERQMKTQKEGAIVDVLGAGGDALLAVMNQRGFFTRYENIRLQRKIGHRLLMFADQRQTSPAYTRRRHVEVKYLPEALGEVPLPVIVWTNGVSLLIFGDEPQSVHLTSRHIRNGYAAQFRALWKMAST